MLQAYTKGENKDSYPLNFKHPWFTATGGLKKTQKHVMLGIALKSLTGSQKVIEII